MPTADAVNALYLSILGRTADTPTLDADVIAVNAGLPLAELATTLATSGEAINAVGALYQKEFGRPPDATGLGIDITYLANGGSLAVLTAVLATSGEAMADINAAYQSELGRAADAGGLAAFQAYLGAGGSLAGVRSALASSAEGQADITASYRSILARAPTAAELTAQTAALATGSLTALAGTLNGQAITNSYIAELGRAPSAAEFAAAQTALGGGGTLAALRGQLATSTEAQADIAALYQQDFGRAPTMTPSGSTPAELTSAEQILASGGSLYAAEYNDNGQIKLASGAPAILPDSSGLGPVLNSVAEAIASTIPPVDKYGLQLYHGPQVFVEQSDILSGIGLGYTISDGIYQIIPSTIFVSPIESYIYGLENFDALVSPNAHLTVDLQGTTTGVTAIINGFNPATDAILFQQTPIVTADQSIIGGVPVYSDGSSTTLNFIGGESIVLSGIIPNQLYPRNLQSY